MCYSDHVRENWSFTSLVDPPVKTLHSCEFHKVYSDNYWLVLAMQYLPCCMSNKHDQIIPDHKLNMGFLPKTQPFSWPLIQETHLLIHTVVQFHSKATQAPKTEKKWYFIHVL